MKYLIVLTLLATACGENYHETVVQAPLPQGTYVGCYTDTPTRALPVNLLWSGATVEACVTIARAQGYKFAGVQYGTQCFAGNVPAYTLVPDSNCNMPCAAAPTEICGGSWHNSVYATGE